MGGGLGGGGGLRKEEWVCVARIKMMRVTRDPPSMSREQLHWRTANLTRELSSHSQTLGAAPARFPCHA